MIEKIEIEKLEIEWKRFKAAELDAQTQRRAIEDRIAAQVAADSQFVGVKKFNSLTITYQFTKSVDSKSLQELAAAAGISDELGVLFRWKPEVDARGWAKASAATKSALSGAITIKPNRPSFAAKSKE